MTSGLYGSAQASGLNMLLPHMRTARWSASQLSSKQFVVLFLVVNSKHVESPAVTGS